MSSREIHFGPSDFRINGFANKRQNRNKRSEAYWRLREALDPATATRLALPPYDNLIQVMFKEQVIKPFGRPTDASDAAVMAWSVYDENSDTATASERH